jgi:hypothetical protein
LALDDTLRDIRQLGKQEQHMGRRQFIKHQTVSFQQDPYRLYISASDRQRQAFLFLKITVPAKLNLGSVVALRAMARVSFANESVISGLAKLCTGFNYHRPCSASITGQFASNIFYGHYQTYLVLIIFHSGKACVLYQLRQQLCDGAGCHSSRKTNFHS